METRKIISSIAYFSIFFAGFIIPIVIYFITDDREVQHHAKKALVSHVLPFASLILFLVLFFGSSTFGSIILASVLCAVLYLAVMIYNVIQGIRVLMDR
ncbi:DUF4870 domain-containing protein [Paenibacillus puerhi]|uniref:DUF4870 domain-containing protein n=1 Tax=Paenibacillus puerhi TaxID=2692622 RepID=UPI00135CC63B|nr:DUF4870 domain-containing protein [Paenibacillus puerhi]